MNQSAWYSLVLLIHGLWQTIEEKEQTLSQELQRYKIWNTFSNPTATEHYLKTWDAIMMHLYIFSWLLLGEKSISRLCYAENLRYPEIQPLKLDYSILLKTKILPEWTSADNQFTSNLRRGYGILGYWKPNAKYIRHCRKYHIQHYSFEANSRIQLFTKTKTSIGGLICDHNQNQNDVIFRDAGRLLFDGVHIILQNAH